MFGIPALKGTFHHHPSFAAAAGTDDAHREAIVVGKALAMVGWDMLTTDGLYEKARSQWEHQLFVSDNSNSQE